jgi:hypothetical protein
MTSEEKREHEKKAVDLMIRKVMRYAGPRMLLYHPVLAIKHAVITLKQKQELKKQQDRSFI